MHTVTGHWQRGFVLALVTAIAWGLLPIALKITLEALDPYTITWFRFLIAALVLGGILAVTRRWPTLQSIDWRTWVIFGVALFGLVGNFVLFWAIYGLAQKSLLKHLTSQQILMLIYAGATVLLLPTASPGEIGRLSTLHAWTLAFCCANTLIAYGAFVEALGHWEVSRVSAVLALAPLFTMTSMGLIGQFAPGLLEPEGLNTTSVIGALLVVGGSAMCALGSP
jgi:drug/metabolite transporter (DMT)-like permease